MCDEFHYEVDQIFHMACPASPVWYQRNPARTIRTCVQGTLNALQCARDVGARIFLASTSEVYGDPAVHPQTEDYVGSVNPIGPRSCYDEGKRCAEALAVSYAEQYGVEVRIARIFNTYGPRMAEDDGRVVSSFICQSLRGRPLTLFGHGSQTRSFMYVDDLVEGIVRLMNFGPEGEAIFPGPVNIGNPEEITVAQLAGHVVRWVGRGEIVHRELPKDDPSRRKPDITRAKMLLAWEPLVPLADGLLRTIQYFREQLLAEEEQKRKERGHV